jgi:dipeptidase D
LDNLALLAGAESSNTFGNFPGWEPDVKSDLVQTLVQTHEKLFQTTPKVYSVHAGLECGLLQGPYPDLVCASIGPQIDGAHSPDERLKLSSVQPWYNWLKSTISVLAQTPTTSN